MLDVKSWLEHAGLPVADTKFIKEQQAPFFLFHDIESFGGLNKDYGIKRHSLTVELYSEGIDSAHENAVESLFYAKGHSFQKERIWNKDQAKFVTVYTLGTITEKIL